MSATTQWEVGDVIKGRWEIHQILTGGMGRVYIVYDREWAEPFAVKALLDEVLAQDKRAADRFADEARTWINLDAHENVVRAKFVEEIKGKLLLFLEYVSGGDLSAWISAKRLRNNVPLVLRLAIQFSDGMVHANSKGIEVHRDIKPQNCMITEGGVLKVTDFGLARAFDNLPDIRRTTTTLDTPAIGQTRTGTVFGTCTHMAPEQFDDAKNVDTRADIYSFGITLFQMLTGELPFLGSNWNEFALLHKRQPLPQINSIDEYLHSILERCCEKVPSRRYQNFATLQSDLRRVFERLTKYPAPKPKVGHELDAYALVNKGASLHHLHRPTEAIACYDQALSINSDFAEAWANKGTVLLDLGQYNRAIQCYDRSLSINPKSSVAWTNMGKVYSASGNDKKAVTCFENALDLNPNDDIAWGCKSIALSKLGQIEEAIASADRCVKINPFNAEAWFNFGALLGRLPDYKASAIKCYEWAIRIKGDYAGAWFNKALVHESLGDFKASIDACDHVIALEPTNAKAWTIKGVGFENLHLYRQAIDCFRNAVRLGHTAATDGIINCERKLKQG